MAAGRSCRRRRLGDDDGEVDDDHLVERGHEGGGERGVPVVAHVGGQVVGEGEGQREDVGEALRQHLLVQHVLTPTMQTSPLICSWRCMESRVMTDEQNKLQSPISLLVLAKRDASS